MGTVDIHGYYIRVHFVHNAYNTNKILKPFIREFSMQVMSRSAGPERGLILAAAGGVFQPPGILQVYGEESDRDEGVPVAVEELSVSQIEAQKNEVLNAQIEGREGDLLSRNIKPFRSAIARCTPETISRVTGQRYDDVEERFKEYVKSFTLREKTAYLYWKRGPESPDQGEEEPLCLWLANEITDTTKQYIGRKDGFYELGGGLKDVLKYEIIKVEVSLDGAPLAKFGAEQKERILGLNWEEILRKSVRLPSDN